MDDEARALRQKQVAAVRQQFLVAKQLDIDNVAEVKAHLDRFVEDGTGFSVTIPTAKGGQLNVSLGRVQSS